LPFVKWQLSAEKPIPKEPVTLGDHIRKRRYELGLFQDEVASRLGVGVHTLVTWERNQAEPAVRLVPKIIAFLGYNPFPKPTTLGERIVARRRSLGIARKRLAWALGVDEGALRNCETGGTELTGSYRARVEWFLAAPPEELKAIVPPPGRARTFLSPPPLLHAFMEA
jgi:DNA-binding transcriptional regulator YiaG